MFAICSSNHYSTVSLLVTVGPVGATESFCQNGYKHMGQFAALENSKN